MKNFIYILIPLFSLSCRPKPIDINVNQESEKMVVFSGIVPEHAMAISLSKTFSSLSMDPIKNAADLAVSNAFITVRSDNVTYTFTEYKPGFYYSVNPIPFKENATYNLTVQTTGKVIQASSVMLPKVPFKSVIPIVEKSETDTTVYVSFAFEDVPTKANWYVINLFKKEDLSSNPIDFFNNSSVEKCKTILISDKEFKDTYLTKVKLPNLKSNDSLVATLSNVNEQYFNYLSYRMNGGDIFSQLNLEPINYPTNIVEGYGFFNMHYPDIHMFDLSKF